MADYAIHDTTLEAIADTIRKKDGTSALIDPADYAERVNLMGMLEEKTASGAIAHIDDGADGVPLKNWLVTLPASLDGYTEVNGTKNTGTGTPETQYTASLGRTIYGGTADIVTGEGEVQFAYHKLTSDDTMYLYNSANGFLVNTSSFAEGEMVALSNSGGLCNAFDTVTTSTNTGVRFGMSNNSNIYFVQVQSIMGSTLQDIKDYIDSRDIYVVYRLATPTPFTFTPITPTPETELGVNNFWADEGDNAVTYRSSGTVTPVPVVPTLITKSITENGTYYAEDDDADGYSSVTVNVQGGETPFVPLFTETKIADNSSHASSFTLSEDYANYDMVKIVWYESATVSGFLYTTPNILDEIFSVGVGKLCINKPSTNYYACYTKSGLTWTRSNQRVIDVHEIYGVTFTNCTMTATDLYKRGASTTTKYAITSQTSLKDYDLFMMSSIHATDGSETMPTTWLYQYQPENMSEAFSCPVPAVLQEYNANDEAFVISEYGMTSARYFMVQGITFTPTPSLLSMSPAPTPSEPDPEDPEEEVEEEET